MNKISLMQLKTLMQLASPNPPALYYEVVNVIKERKSSEDIQLTDNKAYVLPVRKGSIQTSPNNAYGITK